MITALDLERAVKLISPSIECYLKNIEVKGEVIGCSGSLRNPETGTIVKMSLKHAYDPSQCNDYFYHTTDRINGLFGGVFKECKPENLVESVFVLLNRYDDGVETE